MPCYHPLPAWRTPDGQTVLSKPEQKDYTRLHLPCGGCLGCRTAHAQAWALRCQLELQRHQHAVFTTLTYSDDNVPVTLEKRHVQLFLKRLRRSTDRTIRFFASGEYGETTSRPHYHAILYGLAAADHDTIQTSWGLGHTRTYPVTPGAIAYVAGYTSKKIGYKRAMVEQVDPNTGEVYTWQPPFIQMSRRPGIAAHAKQWPHSWRLYAIHQNHRTAVPRFLHNAWKEQATTEQKEELIYEKSKLTRLTKEQLAATEHIAVSRQQEQSRDRQL